VRGKEMKKRLKKAYQKFGNVDYYSYVSFVIRDKDMKRELFLEGIGWVLETTYFRLNSDNVVEPYTEYEIIKPL
jgi:hypothetical protein